MADESDKRDAAPSSDSAARDLLRRREQFLESFGKGTRLSEDALVEYERLVGRLRALEAENAKLRATVEADSAVRELLEKIQELENEKNALVNRVKDVEASGGNFFARCHEIESELSNLANLLVASQQLHASLSPRGVMRRIKEVLAQLVGAERYAVYFLSDDRAVLVPIASEGLTGEELSNLPAKGGLFGSVISSGRSLVVEDRDPSQGTLADPPAIVPLRVDDRVVGVIAVYSTLAQKKRFDTVDIELFQLLGTQAAWALVSATFFAAAEQRLPGLEAFVDLSV